MLRSGGPLPLAQRVACAYVNFRSLIFPPAAVDNRERSGGRRWGEEFLTSYEAIATEQSNN